MSQNRGLEICVVCAEPTERAGRADDSLFCEVCDGGPFCASCFDEHSVECLRKDNTALRGENERLKKLVEHAGHTADALLAEWKKRREGEEDGDGD